MYSASNKRFWLMDDDELERLIELAKAEEREACAKVCDEHAADYSVVGMSLHDAMETGARGCAAAIRERSND